MISYWGVDHGGTVSKARQVYLVPTTKKEQRRERVQNASSSALTGGVGSGLLTAALNARAGRGAALRAGGQMVGIGALIGGGLGAAQKPSQQKMVRRP